MSQQNVELVRSIYAAWERGDFSSTDWADPEIKFVTVTDSPTGGMRTGLTGMAEGWRGWLSAWEEFRVVPDEYRELDEERVLVPTHFTGRGKTSGLEVGQIWTKGATLIHVRGGKVTTLVLYTDHERALADLGLAPEADARRS